MVLPRALSSKSEALRRLRSVGRGVLPAFLSVQLRLKMQLWAAVPVAEGRVTASVAVVEPAARMFDRSPCMSYACRQTCRAACSLLRAQFARLIPFGSAIARSHVSIETSSSGACLLHFVSIRGHVHARRPFDRAFPFMSNAPPASLPSEPRPPEEAGAPHLLQCFAL